MSNFSVINKTIYEINDWKQLVGISSDLNPDLKIAVNSYLNDIIEASVIIIYMESINAPLTSFVISGTDQKLVKSSEVMISKESALNILNNFGFKVKWDSTLPKLTSHTTELLRMALDMGFAYVVHQHQNLVVFYTSDKTFKTLVANELPNFTLCDFSEFETNKFYSIEKLLQEATVEDQQGIHLVFDGGIMEGDIL